MSQVMYVKSESELHFATSTLLSCMIYFNPPTTARVKISQNVDIYFPRSILCT